METHATYGPNEGLSQVAEKFVRPVLEQPDMAILSDGGGKEIIADALKDVLTPQNVGIHQPGDVLELTDAQKIEAAKRIIYTVNRIQKWIDALGRILPGKSQDALFKIITDRGVLGVKDLSFEQLGKLREFAAILKGG